MTCPVDFALPQMHPGDARDQRGGAIAQRNASLLDQLAHMANTEECSLERIQHMCDEDEPLQAAFDPGPLAVECAYIDAPIVPTLRRLEDTIAALVADLSAHNDAGWERTDWHAEHGAVNIAVYLAHVAAEDVDHLAQTARLRDAT